MIQKDIMDGKSYIPGGDIEVNAQTLNFNGHDDDLQDDDDGGGEEKGDDVDQDDGGDDDCDQEDDDEMEEEDPSPEEQARAWMGLQQVGKMERRALLN